eukprot:9787960-Ditylum_brightwellii.AAC.1
MNSSTTSSATTNNDPQVNDDSRRNNTNSTSRDIPTASADSNEHHQNHQTPPSENRSNNNAHGYQQFQTLFPSRNNPQPLFEIGSNIFYGITEATVLAIVTNENISPANLDIFLYHLPLADGQRRHYVPERMLMASQSTFYESESMDDIESNTPTPTAAARENTASQDNREENQPAPPHFSPAFTSQHPSQSTQRDN